MITIAGAGLAGLASAFELARRGAEVRVLDVGDKPGSHSVARFAGSVPLPGWQRTDVDQSSSINSPPSELEARISNRQIRGTMGRTHRLLHCSV